MAWKGMILQAFVEMGAGAVVEWSGPVSVEETDEAVLGFFDCMLSGDSLEVAVEGTGLSIHPAAAEKFRLG